MNILGDAFNIIIFVSLIGSIFSVLMLLVKRILHIVLPLWFSICSIAFFFIPVILPTLKLIPPEKHQWIHGYEIACFIWLGGMIVFLSYYGVRSIFAYNALKKYMPCHDERIETILHDCINTVALKRIPLVYFGTLKDPACVVTLLHPAIILNRDIVEQLTDKELSIILCHEVMHIKRWHHVYQSIFDVVCIIHWFNPFSWIAKSDFSMQCEMDCDQMVLSNMSDDVTEIDYATAMLRLMTLSSKTKKYHGHNIAALGFILAKQRMSYVLKSPSPHKRVIAIMVMVFFLSATILFSGYLSRSHFYPYPAYDAGIEYADTTGIK
ncbi:MAG: M56 family metallopeptidase [Eubacteriales bacterium]|nr:M56 family metallopeptidase [Eubacteriales bacterium]